MTTKEITVDSVGGPQVHIIIEAEDGSVKSFPKDESNTEYVAWLEAQTPKTISK